MKNTSTLQTRHPQKNKKQAVQKALIFSTNIKQGSLNDLKYSES